MGSFLFFFICLLLFVFRFGIYALKPESPYSVFSVSTVNAESVHTEVEESDDEETELPLIESEDDDPSVSSPTHLLATSFQAWAQEARRRLNEYRNTDPTSSEYLETQNMFNHALEEG